MIGQNIKDNDNKKPNSREIDKFKKEFPQFFSKDGEFKLDIFNDFLEQEEVEISKEGYELKFLGKSYAKYQSSLETETYISPDIEHNEKDENRDSENIYIVGDNIDALKHLLSSYAGKIKCIYIDPPYNTGSDGFVYPDKFQFNAIELAGKIGVNEEEAQRILDLSGKSTHSAWLTFMYPRLILARDLLADEGVILISISDIEHANLKLICDDIFNEENFIEDFIWVNEGNTDNQDKIIRNHEYIVAYAKDKGKLNVNKVVDPNISDDSKAKRTYVENSMIKNGYKNPPSYITLPAGFPCEVDSAVFEGTVDLEIIIEEIEENGYISRAISDKYNLHFPLHKQKMVIKNGVLLNDIKVYSGWSNNKKLEKFIDNNCQPIDEGGEQFRFFIKNSGAIYYRKDGREPQRILTTLQNMGSTEKEKNRLEKFGLSFDYPKPVKLMEYLISIFAKKDDIVLDFFSGSGTTAEAVLSHNINSESNFKFIAVQLPEKIKESDAAYQIGYKTIDEIGRDRIKKAGEKIKEETGADIDYGFKLYHLETPEEKILADLEEFVLEIKFVTDDMISVFDSEYSNGKDSILATWLNEDGYGLSRTSNEYKLEEYSANLIDKSLYIIDKGLESEDVMALIKRIEEDVLDITRIVVYVHSVQFNVLQELRKNIKVLRNNKNVTLIERF